MALPVAAVAKYAPMAISAINSFRDMKNGGNQGSHQDFQQQQQHLNANWDFKNQFQGADNVMAAGQQGGQHTGFNPRFSGLASDLMAAGGGAIAGFKAAKDNPEMNAGIGALKGGVAGFFQKNAFDNVQKDGGGIKVAAYSAIAGAAMSGFEKDGPGMMGAAMQNMGMMSATDFAHDKLTDMGKDGMADMVAGGGTAASTLNLTTDMDMGELALKGGGVGAALGAGFGAINGNLGRDGAQANPVAQLSETMQGGSLANDPRLDPNPMAQAMLQNSQAQQAQRGDDSPQFG